MTRTLYRDGALADARSDRLEIGVSILVVDGRIAWIRPSDDEGPTGPPDPARDAPDDAGGPPRDGSGGATSGTGTSGATPGAARPIAAESGHPGDLEIVDASGSTFVPGLVDCHSHLTLPGGAHWIDRIDDPPMQLAAVAEMNAQLLRQAGIRWARDVGAPRSSDPVDGRLRALSLGVRDRWRDDARYPNVRAAGTWLDRAGTLPTGGLVEARDAAELLANAIGQLEEGADFLKLYLDGPEPGVAPWSADEIRPVVEMAHARGVRVTAHSGHLAGARVCVDADVDSIEHGMELDAELAARMAAQGIALVSTLSIFRSWDSFARTTALPRFASPEGRAKVAARRERAEELVRLARAAGVTIATGTDFGGGSTRANQLAWEVECLVAAGFEPWEALASATWRGGLVLGEPEAGTVHEDGPADFALVHGDPLSDPTALWRIWRVAWGP